MSLRDEIMGVLSEKELAVLSSIVDGPAVCVLEVGHWNGLSTAAILGGLTHGTLVTIDHHLGDAWVPQSNVENVLDVIRRYRQGATTVVVYNEPFESALPKIFGEFDVVFYDANHTVKASLTFFELARRLMPPGCLLIIDDRDFEGSVAMTAAALNHGFTEVETPPFQRLGGDKANPKTFTLRVLKAP